MSDKVKSVVKQEVDGFSQLANSGIRSGAYLYPIKGIFYFISHRSLWKPLTTRLLPTLTLGTGITIAMFLVTYVPQLAVLAFTSGPLAAVSAALLVLSESSTLTMLLSKTYLIPDSLLDVFDGTLVAQGDTALVAQERPVKPAGAAGDAISRLGKRIGKPFQKLTNPGTALIRYLVYLPLNAIPVVGTVLFVCLQGQKYGPHAHERYFQLRSMSSSQKKDWVQARQGAYSAFGIPAVLLEMVPVVGIFFAFTNTCGAALWASDLEKRRGQGSTAEDLREKAKRAE